MGKRKQPTLTRERLASALVTKTSLNAMQAAEAVEALFETLGGALQSGQPIEVRGFGSFRFRERAGRTGRHPKTGEPIHIQPRKLVRFQLSRKVKI